MPGIDEIKCVLVTGATSGIGRALALAIANLPSRPKVIAAGRRLDRLQELAKHNIETLQVDLDTDSATIKKFADTVLDKFPDLDSVILCAGVQHEFDLKQELDLRKIASELNINYTSVVSLVSALMPHFIKLASSGHPCFIVPVTAGLGISPGPSIPNYSASKAALRSYTLSLRIQLRGTNIHILELIPPLVESELHDPYGTSEMLSKFWMPLDQYTRVTLEKLRKGEPYISAGVSQTYFDRFEVGKYEVAEEFQRSREEW